MTYASLAFWLADLRDGPNDRAASARRSKDDRPTAEAPAELSAEDQTVVTQIRSGDSAAFEALYEKFLPRLLPYAIERTGDSAVAADIVHDVFLSIWRRRAHFALSTTLVSYLYVAVRNRASNSRKRAARDASLRSSALPFPSFEPSAEDTTDRLTQADLVDRVWAEVARLPENRREAITLRWRDGLSPNDIARVLNVTPAAAKMLVSRGLQTLRERLSDLFE